MDFSCQLKADLRIIFVEDGEYKVLIAKKAKCELTKFN